MATILKENITSLEVIKVLPEVHEEVKKVIEDKHLINKVLSSLDFNEEVEPLFFDPSSPRYYIIGRNGRDVFNARVLRRFIDIGEGWYYINDESFLEELENSISDVLPSKIEKPEEGCFTFAE